ncbi:MAG: glycosyltransferase family 4 protein [Victivallales bacterium]|nr:glycosyltransferase family 4 protein [Victivallales bacterium]
MQILISLYKYMFWGGLQKDTLRLAEELHSRGHRVTMFTTDWPNPPEFINVEQVKVCGFSNVARMRAFSDAWLARLAKGGFDVSVAMERVPGADFYFAADSCMKTYYERKYPKWLLRIHPRYRYILDTERKVCGKDSRTVIWHISPFQKEEFQREYDTPDEHLFALPPGMNPKCVRPASQAEVAAIRDAIRKELNIPQDAIVLVIVGSNIMRKGIDRMFKAATTLPDKWREKVELLLVGNLNNNDIEKIARQNSLENRYVLTGARQDVEKLLLASDMMVHPAREEGTGTVLVEGIASGIPVICTGCCGFSPIVNEAAGLVVPEPFEQESLNTMLANALDNLAKLTDVTREYAKNHDFTSRQKVMVDCIEGH